MSSNSSDSSPKSRKSSGEHSNDTVRALMLRINQLKKQIQSERSLSVKANVEENKERLETHLSQLVVLTASRTDASTFENENNGLGKMLSSRIENPLCKVSGLIQESGERDCASGQEVVTVTTAKLPFVDKLPPYTTWIFLDRNQRMAEDQSVVGRRRIYYDQHGSEALICSDSEEENAETEEKKHDFSEGEDRILWMVSQEFGLSEKVLNILTQFIGGSTSGIQDRCSILEGKYTETEQNLKDFGEKGSERNLLLEKSLSTALDSFDNLFCRRCLVFDCRLHGCSQVLIDASEKQSYSPDNEARGKPCSDQCYLQLKASKDLHGDQATDLPGGSESKILEEPRSLVCLNTREQGEHTDSNLKRKALEPTYIIPENEKLVSDELQDSCNKKLKLSVPSVVSLPAECVSDINEPKVITDDVDESHKHSSESSCLLSISGDNTEANERIEEAATDGTPNRNPSSSFRRILGKGLLGISDWKPLEKELYLKGVEIFGRNSCLIARNLLPGLKTCIEVSSYMCNDGAATHHGSSGISCFFPGDNGKALMDRMVSDMPGRSRLLRRRGRTRKLKYSSKSAGHPSMWRRIADGKNQSCKQYTPCGCQFMCGKQCPCLQNSTCCEKYCGCSKSCKNRFRGCHCAKSQCRSRQCPCFAAGRECDPDVCRNCWVSCGDASLGEPPRQGDGQCGNMRLLLRQQQRILLAKSDVAGWGAFLKNPVNKNDYLGEYTGELISHREADKRGKIYDRANSSFLFDLNDQFVLDAYRKGDKLKFANHSSNPNCYAKVMLVAGDHRVGIFAKDRIEASEELFYDYRYGPDQAPIWARKPEDLKRDDSPVPQGRPKKHHSH
ncbi:histone-lysine N-methyltransferase EZA1 [Ipomoea triloba]|uniref:histone-lysine N-methyltransferase EZA1 n=1 Tax=Ipomoea triloba TaxID=35885 RepID=UPI00125E3D9A|nr:histone-lysine N-methyltransferase EZA1 [Ipomoea triloba]